MLIEDSKHIRPSVTKGVRKVKTWRCELYADVLLQYPCLTFYIQAVDLEQANATMRAGLKNIQVMLRPGVMSEESGNSVRFEKGERIRAFRYIPETRLEMGDRFL